MRARDLIRMRWCKRGPNGRRSLLCSFALQAAGWALLAVGLALLVLPGPGIPVVVAGLAVLATEYHWAHRWLHALKARGTRLAARLDHRRHHSRAGAPPDRRPAEPEKEVSDAS